MNSKELAPVLTYQCPGCVSSDFPSCYKRRDGTVNEISCENHKSGTIIVPIGNVFLGMPKGFNRCGVNPTQVINVFPTFNDGWGYDTWNIPVWKYLTDNGHTMVRGLSPRNNIPFVHIFLEDCISKIDCLEITKDLHYFMN